MLNKLLDKWIFECTFKIICLCDLLQAVRYIFHFSAEWPSLLSIGVVWGERIYNSLIQHLSIDRWIWSMSATRRATQLGQRNIFNKSTQKYMLEKQCNNYRVRPYRQGLSLPMGQPGQSKQCASVLHSLGTTGAVNINRVSLGQWGKIMSWFCPGYPWRILVTEGMFWAMLFFLFPAGFQCLCSSV
jgi:hypothetical protein